MTDEGTRCSGLRAGSVAPQGAAAAAPGRLSASVCMSYHSVSHVSMSLASHVCQVCVVSNASAGIGPGALPQKSTNRDHRL